MTSIVLKFKYEATSWDESNPLDTFSSPSLTFTRVRSERVFSGDLVGKGVDESMFVYHPAEEGTMSATYSGLMHVDAEVKGEKSEAVFIVYGAYTNTDGPVTEWILDERSATGAFKGLKGRGNDKASGEGKEMEVVLELSEA